MLKVIVIFSILATVWADFDDVNEKYIDLLPEEEKQQFLDRIARRILEGIQNDDTPNESHVDVNDDQLDKHDVFVQNIIHEESTNLKKEKRIDLNKSNEVINITLFEGKRDNRKQDEKLLDTTKGQTYYDIPVQTIYDGYDTMSVSNISTLSTDLKGNYNKMKYSERRDSNKENIEPHLLNNTDTNKFLRHKNVQINNFSWKSTTIEVNKVHLNSSKYNVSDITDSKITTSPNTENINRQTNQSVNEDVKKSNNILIMTDEPIENIETETNKVQTESVTKNINELTAQESPSRTEGNSDTTIGHHRRGTDVETNKYSTDIENVDEILTLTTATEMSLNTIFPTAQENTLNVTQDFENNYSETSKVQYNFTKQYISGSSFREPRDLSDKENDIPKLNLVKEPKKEYKVYEFDPEKRSFVIPKESQQVQGNEQPNYVPVFNYAPENAYFKPLARYRHTEHKDTKSLEKQQEPSRKIKHPDLQVTNRFFGNNKRFPFKQNYQNSTKNIYPREHNFLKPTHSDLRNRDIYYHNPDDHFDMEYDIDEFKGLHLRNGLRAYKFPDSDEADHLINSVHNSNSVKDHIRAVRNLFYLQGIFGILPDIQRKHENISNLKLDQMKSLDVAADYYFERMFSKEVGHAQHSSVLHRSKITKSPGQKYPFYVDGVKRNKLKNLNGKLFEKLFQAMITVLNDIIRFDNKALEQYSWLDTTVEIQMAIRTLLDTLNKLKYGHHVESKDMEVFKFTLYLYKRASGETQEYEDEECYPNLHSKNRSYKSLLPKNRKKIKTVFATQIWKDFRSFIRQKDISVMKKLSIFSEFEYFLKSLQSNLYDLHEAIKNIAIITRYDTQNWFKDLKDVYLKNAVKKQIGQVILHLALAYVLDGVGPYRKQVEGNFRSFIKNHKKVDEDIKEDFVFVLFILKELNKM